MAGLIDISGPHLEPVYSISSSDSGLSGQWSPSALKSDRSKCGAKPPGLHSQWPGSAYHAVSSNNFHH